MPNKQMNRFIIINTLMLEAKKKYPFTCPIMPNSQLSLYINNAYRKIVWHFMRQSSARMYRGRVSKTTIKYFHNWTPPFPLQ